MGCCGKQEVQEEGMTKKRRCRDILCLLIFVAFWAGMFIVAGIAFTTGDPNRLVYGVDSYGFSCGGVNANSFQNASFDLSNQTNVHYLNALDLLRDGGAQYAKHVCVNACPTNYTNTVCDSSSGPCSSPSQFTCPYYRFSQRNLYGSLTGVANTSVNYFDFLPNTVVVDVKASAFLASASYISSNWSTYISNLNLVVAANSSVGGAYLDVTSNVPGQGPCYPNSVSESAYLHRCVPNFPASWKTSVVDTAISGVASVSVGVFTKYASEFQSAGNQWDRYVGDISKGILLIVIAGLAGGVVFSGMWLLILRYLSGLMVWLTLILVNLFCIGICLYSFVKAGFLGNDPVTRGVLADLPSSISPTQSDTQNWKYIAYGTAALAAVILLLTLLSISRMRIAIACIKVASQAVGSMPSIMVFPFLPFIFIVGLVIYWVAVTGMLYSAGTLTAHCRPASTAPKASQYTFASFANLSSASLAAEYSPNYNSEFNFTAGSNNTCYTNVTEDQRRSACGADPNCYISYDWNTNLKYAFIYHFFGLLWTSQFIVGFGSVTIAGAIGSYYWGRGDSSQMPIFPVLSAIKNTSVYHLGSIAFGSFIIAVIMFLRCVLEYLNARTKQLQANNKFAEWLMCCARCCMWVLQKIVQFINRNAYIIVGVKGTNYCVSAAEAVKLIVTNALRMAVVNIVGGVLIFLGKIAVAAACGLIAFAMSETKYYTDSVNYPNTYLSSAILPIALSVIIGFFVSDLFFAVYEMAIDTILLSFCEDCEMNGGNPKYAPPLLAATMAKIPLVKPPAAAPIKG